MKCFELIEDEQVNHCWNCSYSYFEPWLDFKSECIYTRCPTCLICLQHEACTCDNCNEFFDSAHWELFDEKFKEQMTLLLHEGDYLYMQKRKQRLTADTMSDLLHSLQEKDLSTAYHEMCSELIEETIEEMSQYNLCCDQESNDCECSVPILPIHIENLLANQDSQPYKENTECGSCAFYFTAACTPLREWVAVDYMALTPLGLDRQIDSCDEWTEYTILNEDQMFN